MFKRGGSSYESQGTGITSPYDTPRKKYNIGTTFEDIYSQMREKTKDSRGDFSYAAQGFSNLANPYKESGEAKTIGEMLWEGAQGVRGSKEKASELERTGELAVLSSQGERLAAAEAHKRKLEELRISEKLKGTYPDMHPGKLYDDKIKGWKVWVKNNEGRAGHVVVSTNVEAFADADMIIRDEKIKAYTAGKKSLAQAVPPSAFKDNGEIDISILIGGVVYYDPMSKEWFTISNPGTESAEVIVAESYIDGWNNIDPSTSPDSEKNSADKLSETDETIKTKKKEAKKEISYLDKEYKAEDYKPKASVDVIEESIKTADQSGKDITEFWKWVASPKGVALQNKNTDQATTELDQLKGWWNDQAWNTDEG